MDCGNIDTVRERGISLLSLDGGGVRGLSALLILQRIMESIDPNNPPKPCDYFDMICGTSTGGLIAIMLGRLQMSVAECIEEYKTLSPVVFKKRRSKLSFTLFGIQVQGRFDHEALESKIKDLLRRRGLDEDELLKERNENPRCKTFVCTMSQKTSKIVIFPSYYPRTLDQGMSNRIRIWEAARATSAATSFFEPLAIDGQIYVDGATGANNPIYELWAEASSMFRLCDGWRLENHLKCLVSIGTGVPRTQPFGPGLTDITAALTRIATESESKSKLFQRQHPFLVENSILFRFNVTSGLEEIGLEAADRLGDIEDSTNCYCASIPIIQQIQACASRLKDKQWVVDAILAFDRHLKNPFTVTPYCNLVGDHPEPKLGTFVHTIAFQQWLCGRERSIICATPAGNASTHDPGSPQNQLAASLSKHSEEIFDSVVLYVNCFSLLQTPKQGRLETLRKEEMGTDSDADDEGDTIMKSLYYQLFNLCTTREKILGDYDSFLLEKDSFHFRTHIIGQGIPRGQDLLQLISRLLSCSTKPVIIAIDSVHIDTGRAARPRGVRLTLLSGFTRNFRLLSADNPIRFNILDKTTGDSLISNLTRLGAQASFKSILCGDESILERNNTGHYNIITINTEIQECLASLSFEGIDVRKSQVAPAAEGTTSWIWSHPVYQSFSMRESGILWICGKPGSGKSVLAKSIQGNFRESVPREANGVTPPNLGDWFYHRRGGGDFVRHESFIRSILYHFLQQSSKFFHDFLQEPYRQMDPREKSTWTYKLLVDIFRAVCMASTPMLIIIDAIDEAENTEVLHLIKSVVSPATYSKSKFIVLGRRNVLIEREICNELTIVVEHENRRDIERIIEIGLTSIRDSIHSFDFNRRNGHHNRRHLLRHRRTHQPRSRPLTIMAEREKQIMRQIGELLKSKAQGSMLWVKLVLDKLIHRAQTDSASSLDDLHGLVSQVPEQLAEYYQQLAHELTARKDERAISEIRMALMWICAAAEIGDVTLENLWEALALIKSKFEAKTLGEVWRRQINMNSYDELWRKISVICGPFIEILNPGLSAAESRILHYTASSRVQLMHQSMRDFFCDPSIKDHSLHFSLDEARDLVKNQLEYYLRVSLSDLHELRFSGPQESLVILDWLNEQRLIPLAIAVGKTQCRDPFQELVRIGVPKLKGVDKDADGDLIQLAQEYWDNGNDILSPAEPGRLAYHACKHGLVTAMRNLFFLKWLIEDTFDSPNRNFAILCILVVASRCQSSAITVELDLPDPEILPKRLQPAEYIVKPGDSDDKWVATPWTVVISVDKGNAHIRHRVVFDQWNPFLDMVCGSKRPRFQLDVSQSFTVDRQEDEEDEIDDEPVIPLEDVEDTIITALRLGLEPTH